MRLFLFLLFPFIEIYLFIQVGDEFGYLAAFAGLILAFVVGANLLRFTKAKSAQNLMDAFASAQTSQTAPAAAMGTVMAQMVAAILLMIPGYLSDIFALLLLFPLTRSLLMLFIVKRLMKSGAMKFGFGQPNQQNPFQQPFNQSPFNQNSQDKGNVFEGEATEVKSDPPKIEKDK